MFAAYIFFFFAMLSVSKLSAFFFRGTFCVVRSALSSQNLVRTVAMNVARNIARNVARIFARNVAWNSLFEFPGSHSLSLQDFS